MPGRDGGEVFKDFETKFKAFLLADPSRMGIFDNFLCKLRYTASRLGRGVWASPEDAISLLVHQITIWPIVKKLVDMPEPKNKVSNLVHETILALLNNEPKNMPNLWRVDPIETISNCQT